MKYHVYPSTDTATPRRALLLFAGWAMDEKPFARLRHEGYDLFVVWDYRDPTFPPALTEELARYCEMAVIAWSFGVPAAARFIATHRQLPLTARIAVNGTMHPIDDELGIPQSIFHGTIEGLDEKSLSKFNLRMCGGASRLREFSECAPQRPVSELRDELTAVEIAAGYNTTDISNVVWDCAVISSADRIIPPANQLKAWQLKGEALDTAIIDAHHFPDFQTIIDRFITAKGRVAEKFGRATATYDSNATVQRDIARKLIEFAKPFDESIPTVLEIGCGTGLTTSMIAETLGPQLIDAWDLHIAEDFPRAIGDTVIAPRECDAETAVMELGDDSIDMLFSASTVQWFNSLPEFLRQTRRILRPGGLALISTFGPETMCEIRPMLRDAAHYPTADALRRMVPPGLSVIRFEDELRTLEFPSPLEALRHVKLTGVNALSGHHSGADTRSLLRRYPLCADGRAPLTYNPIYIILKKQ